MTLDYNDLTDRQLLVLLADRAERVDHAINGNGQPGLIQDVAALKQEVDDVRDSIPSTPSATERWGVIGGVLVAVVSIGAKVLGVPLPL